MPTIAFYITRTELSAANLSLVDSGYEIPEEDGRPLVDDGNAPNIINAVESAWMDGDTMVHRRKGKAAFGFQVDLIGSSHSDLDTKETTLRAAVDQSSFEIHYTLDSVDRGYACQPFQTFQPLWNAEFVNAYIRRVQVVVPRQPNLL